MYARVGDVEIRRWDFCAPFAGLFNLLHVPHTERRPTKLDPYLTPRLLLPNDLPIREALDVLDERAGEVDLVCMRGGEIDD